MQENWSGTGPSSHLDALLGRVERALADDLLPVEIFNDAAIFRAEMQRIFANSWVFVAHESEIPRQGLSRQFDRQ